jgi:hypothetical protein
VKIHYLHVKQISLFECHDVNVQLSVTLLTCALWAFFCSLL